MSQIGSASSATLTAFFDERDDAQEAVDRLISAGISEANVRLVPGADPSTTQSTQATGTQEHKGFFEALADFFMPDEDRYSYAEGLRRGGYLLTVSNIPDGLYDTAVDILDDEGAVDFDARENSWRSEGWNGYTSAATTESLASGGTGATGTTSLSGTSGSSYGTTGTTAGYASGTTASSGFGSTGTARTDEEVIPVVSEELRIGKRDVNLGRVRVRSYVREEPVNEQVNLRDERVEVERRVVDRPVSGTEAAFQDRVIEAEEHAEEAVVSKTARVTEEIALRKDSTERQETVSDTVRHTEVEVEDERGRIDRSGTTDRS